MTTVNGKPVICVGTVGHIDHLNAQQAAKAFRALSVTAIVAAEGLANLRDAFGRFKIRAPDPISRLERYALESMKLVDVKPQPFWTQQGRRKKGKQGRY